jgi:hypothetical protein
MPEAQLDLDALQSCTNDLMGMMNGDLKTRHKLDAQADSEIESSRKARRTPEEAADAEARQQEHAAKLQQQRKETAEREAAETAQRKAAAKKHVAGTMGIGRVPVDVGDVSGAYEYELEYSEVTIYVPLPEGVGRKQLQVDVGPRALAIGLKGKAPYLKGTFKGVIHPDDMLWMIEDGAIKMELTKADRENWDGCIDLPDGWKCDWSL